MMAITLLGCSTEVFLLEYNRIGMLATFFAIILNNVNRNLSRCFTTHVLGRYIPYFKIFTRDWVCEVVSVLLNLYSK